MQFEPASGSHCAATCALLTAVKALCTYPKKWRQDMYTNICQNGILSVPAAHLPGFRVHTLSDFFRVCTQFHGVQNCHGLSDEEILYTRIIRVCTWSFYGDMQGKPVESYLKGLSARHRACKGVCRAE